METSDLGHYTVYLPAYDDKTLLKYLGAQKDVKWQVFSKRQKQAYQSGNVEIFPVNNEAFNKSLASCTGLLTGGGFEGPAEALFLQKKVMMIPMKGQYEQQCNALSASKLGVPVVSEINDEFNLHLNNWVNDSKKIVVDFPDETAAIVDKLVKQYTR